MVTTDLDVRDTDVRSVCFFYLPKLVHSFFLFSLISLVHLQFFRKFHAAYVDAVSNPFHVPGKKITSRTFSESVTNIVTSYSFN